MRRSMRTFSNSGLLDGVAQRVNVALRDAHAAVPLQYASARCRHSIRAIGPPRHDFLRPNSARCLVSRLVERKRVVRGLCVRHAKR
jgi:hypothetical protein